MKNQTKIRFLLLISILFVINNSIAAVPVSEKNALVALYNSAGGASWTNSSNWNTGDPCDNSWFGVACGVDTVIELNLQLNNLIGTIPTEIGDLSNITFLALNSNQLNGSIPASIVNLTDLTDLILNNNELSGLIPNGLGALIHLEFLRLSDNFLIGTIPADFAGMINLKKLWLFENDLTGALPSALGSLSSLEEMYLYRNQITGTIPVSFGSLSNLLEMNLGNNLLTGEIPASLGLLTSLTELNLKTNFLTGEIPMELGNMTSLISLGLNSNQLIGAIPNNLSNLSNLTKLLLGQNELTGVVPSFLDNLTNLVTLDLGVNHLSGAIPDLSSLVNLKILKLYKNQLTGPIPLWLSSLTALLELNLSDNHLSGTIPSGFGNLTNLTKLLLQENQLGGSIPPALGNMSSLTRLSLYYNKLNGKVPASLDSLSSLTNINVVYNGITENLSSIDLNLNCGASCNWLDSQTLPPEEIGNQIPSASDHSLSLSWDRVSFASPGGYIVFRADAEVGPYVEIGQIESKDINAYIDTGLNSNQQYFYKVKSFTNPHLLNQNIVISDIGSFFSATTDTLTSPDTDLTLDIILDRIRPQSKKNAPIGYIVEYQIVVENTSNETNFGVELIYNFPVGFINTTWLCTASAGATCPSGGNASIDVLLDMASGASLTFDFEGEVDTNEDNDLTIASIALPPSGVYDIDISNNSDLFNIALYFEFKDGFE